MEEAEPLPAVLRGHSQLYLGIDWVQGKCLLLRLSYLPGP